MLMFIIMLKITTPETTDACIGHPDGNGNYHYHLMSPCLMDSSSF